MLVLALQYLNVACAQTRCWILLLDHFAVSQPTAQRCKGVDAPRSRREYCSHRRVPAELTTRHNLK